MKKSFLFLMFFGILTSFSNSFVKGMKNPYLLTDAGRYKYVNADYITLTKDIVIADLGTLRLEILGIKQDLEARSFQEDKNKIPFSDLLEASAQVSTTLGELRKRLDGVIDVDINKSMVVIMKELEELNELIRIISQDAIQLERYIKNLLTQIEQDYGYLSGLQLEDEFLEERNSLISELDLIYKEAMADLNAKKVKLEGIIIKLNPFIIDISFKIEKFLEKIRKESFMFSLASFDF
jgi:hypothetical protein